MTKVVCSWIELKKYKCGNFLSVKTHNSRLTFNIQWQKHIISRYLSLLESKKWRLTWFSIAPSMTNNLSHETVKNSDYLNESGLLLHYKWLFLFKTAHCYSNITFFAIHGLQVFHLGLSMTTKFQRGYQSLSVFVNFEFMHWETLLTPYHAEWT